MNILRLGKIFWGKIINKALTALSILFKKNFTKPDGIYYLISNKCNFRCSMCQQWQWGEKEKPEDYIGTKSMKKVIDQAASWGVKSFGISGGEPLIYKEKMLDLLTYANKKKLYTHFVTNGWLLDEKMIKAYDLAGGGHVSLSLDSTDPLHDELRGVAGAWAQVEKAIKLFEKIQPKNILLKINLVLSDKNISKVLAVIKLTKKINASVFIQPYDPYNWHTRKKLTHRQYHKNYPLWVSPKHMDDLRKLIKMLIKIKEHEPSLIINSKEHLKAMSGYFDLSLERENCYIGYRSFVIGPFGEVSICRFGEVGNVLKNSIKQIWNNAKYEQARKAALKCNFNCLLGCMYDPSLFSWFRSGLNLIRRKIIKI